MINSMPPWTSWDILQVRTPERFWFTEVKAAQYREQLVKWSSEWMFLYEWADQYDTTGTETGGSYYDRVAHSPWYAVSDIESWILEKMDKTRKACSRKKNHIEFGVSPGKANKFINIIYQYFSQNKPYKHIDIDSSWSLINLFLNEYEVDWIQLVEFTWIQTDWRKKWVIDHIDDKVYYRLWWSIGNFSEDQVIEILRNLSSDSQFVGRDIIIWHFLRPEEPDKKQKIEKLKAQYSWPEIQEWIMKGFAALGFDTTKLEFCVEYEPWVNTPDRIKVGAKLLEDMEVDIWWWQKVLKHAGEHMWAITSRRYTKEQFWSLAEKAGCSLQQSYSAYDASMAVSVLKTPRKPFPLQTKLASMIAGSLLLVIGGMEIGKAMENFTWKSKQEKTKQELLYWLEWQLFPSEIEEWKAKMLFVLEHRYGNKLTSSNRHILEWLIEDFIVTNPHYFKNRSWGGWWQIYSTDLFYPTEYHIFVAQNKQLLQKMHMNTLPNEHLLQYDEALKNTYFYRGDAQNFETIDQEIGEYWTDGTWITSSGGSEEWWVTWLSVKTWVVTWQWKQFFVIKLGDNPYRLTEKDALLQSQWIVCTGDVASELLSRGEVQLLTKKIHDYLIIKYGDWHTWYTSWQQTIAKVLLDFYARWGNLEFLSWSEKQQYWWWGSVVSPLHQFIFWYLIHQVDLDPFLQEMWAIEVKSNDLLEEIENNKGLSERIDQLDNFLMTYIPTSWVQIPEGQKESILLQLLITDQYSSSLDVCDHQMVRAWVTKHRELFISRDIEIPAFPEWVEDFLDTTSNPRYYPEDRFVGLEPEKDVDNTYTASIFKWDYIDAYGNRYSCGIYSKKWWDWRLVARKYNTKTGEQLWEQYKKGMFGKVYSETFWRAPSYELTEKWLVVRRLLQIKLFFSSQDAHDLIADYYLRKDAMEKLK
jgi:uncharacterized SAM-dependent methyltransferase